ncbi:ABC transporter permease [Hyphobacterium sp. CCMP332]|nr:ABC transporter permease [Hyphobacterium sp. CCMP332]
MLKNILITAWRNTIRDKGYSLLNLLGLSVSIIASLLLVLYINHELSYENFHEKRDRIFRIVSHFQERDDEFSWASTQPPLGKQIKADYPEIEEYVRLNGIGNNTKLKIGNKVYNEDDLILADSTYFDIFSHTFFEGDPASCLDEPNSIVLTKSLADKYFGDEPALGKTIEDSDGESLKVTGVIEDLPRNTHMDFTGLVSLNSIENLGGGWGSFYLRTFILLKDNVNPETFKSKLPEVIVNYVDPIFEQYGVKVEYEMQVLSSIHLFSNTDGEQGGGSIGYIYIFSIVVVFMLAIAAINYMNLATARSERRAREVGIRKVLGSYKWMLILQFISESLILTLSALIISLASIKFIFLRPFNAMTSREFYFSDIFQAEIVLSIIAMLFLLGILGGSYPAFYLSGFKPVKVLKGRFVHGKNSVPLRKILVVVQFAISIAMIISTIIVFDQLSFLRNKDLGFAKDQILVVPFGDQSMAEKYDILKNELSQNSDIISMSCAMSSPGRGYPKNLLPIESKDGFVEKGVNFYRVDQDYIPTLEIELLQGRNFSKDLASDSNSVIVNQLFVDRMDWDEPIGKRIRVSRDDDEQVEYLYVIGVMEDFHQLSLYQELEPLAFFYGENLPFVHIKFHPDKVKSVQKNISEIWEKVYPNQPFDSYFLDQRFFESYEADEKRSKVFTLFSGITIFIACIGLLGLASYSAEQKTKEIGIRKVLGANERNIIFLLTKEFFILIFIALGIASLASYFLMNNWLNDSFVYHTTIHPKSFLYAGLIAVFFVLITVGFQAFRAANNNPVDALRTE